MQTWATAYNSVADYIAGEVEAAGDILYVGHNTTDVLGASTTYTGPASGLPITLISVTQGTGSIAGGGFVYQAAINAQIDCSASGTYTMLWNGPFAFYGIWIKTGNYLRFSPDSNEGFYAKDCKFEIGDNDYLDLAPSTNGRIRMVNCEVSCVQDAGTSSGKIVQLSGMSEIQGMTLTNVSNRTGPVFFPTNIAGLSNITGIDFTNLTTPTLVQPSATIGSVYMAHCKTPASYTAINSGSTVGHGQALSLVNVGNTNRPWHRNLRTSTGLLEATSSIKVTGGATIDGTGFSWGGPTAGIETTADCNEDNQFCLPWVYGTFDSTGAKTVSVPIVNDTANFTNAEVWLEVEAMETASSSEWTYLSSARATRLSTAEAHATDSGSTWTGTGPSYTYKQTLSQATTVAVTGMFRWRVVIGLASIASSRNFYIDPKETIT